MGRIRLSDSSSREDEKLGTRGRNRECSGEKNRVAEYGGKDHNRKWIRCKKRGRETLRDEDGDVDGERKENDMDERMEESRIMTKNEGDASPDEANKVEKPKESAGTYMAANLRRSGGVYVPRHKLARTMMDIQVKSTIEYQRMTWDELSRSFIGLFNRVTASNLEIVIPKLFAVNLIRGRGLFCRSCMGSQMVSPGLTDVLAGLVAVVNTMFPEIGDLLLRRIILQLQRAFKRGDKPQLVAAVKFIAHLVNQRVAHELIALDLVTLLLEKPTDDSVEVAVGFLTQCGSVLQDLSPRLFHDICEQLRGILHGGNKLFQFFVELLFELREAKFQGYPAIRPGLDLVEQEDQVTHKVSLLDEIDPEIALDIFDPDPQFLKNEKRHEELKMKCLVRNLRIKLIAKRRS